MKLIVTGSIGVGKTTFIKHLCEYIKKTSNPSYEPPCFTETFLNHADTSVKLGTFYKKLGDNVSSDECEWFEHFQNDIATNAGVEAALADEIGEKVCILERCALDCSIFQTAMSMYNTDIRFSFDVSKYKLPKNVRVVVMVTGDIKTTMENIRRRNRPGEEEITEKYLQCCIEAYDSKAETLYKEVFPEASFITINSQSMVDIDQCCKSILNSMNLY